MAGASSFARRRPASVRRLDAAFTPAHRGGSGEPLVLLHGFTDTWRTWELVLPALERRHDVLAPTLPGHAGGPPLEDGSLEDRAGRRGRARDGRGRLRDRAPRRQLARRLPRAAARGARAGALGRRARAGRRLGGGRRRPTWRRSTSSTTMQRAGERSRAARRARSLAHAGGPPPRDAASWPSTASTSRPSCSPTRSRGVAACTGGGAADRARAPRRLAAGRRADRRARCGSCGAPTTAPRRGRARAARFRDDGFPHADWVELDGVGHCPQLDVPLEAAQLILGFTAP